MSGSEVFYCLQQGDRLEQPVNCPSSIFYIMLKCWQWDEKNRPTFCQLFRLLKIDPNEFSFKRTLKSLSSSVDLQENTRNDYFVQL